MDLVFPAPSVSSLSIAGEQASYPVGRIFCVGRNYAAHAAEMGVEVDRATPFYFTKPASAVVSSGSSIAYPPGTDDLHHEIELVVALGAPLFRATPEAALAAVFGYAVGLDLTRRDLQARAKDKRQPWDLGKAFEQSAPIAPLSRAKEFGPLSHQTITLLVNGDLRQSGRLDDMVWSVPELLADLSQYYHLGPGDVVMTGTPSGVGPLQPGDRLRGEIAGLTPLEIAIAPAE